MVIPNPNPHGPGQNPTIGGACARRRGYPAAFGDAMDNAEVIRVATDQTSARPTSTANSTLKENRFRMTFS